MNDNFKEAALRVLSKLRDIKNVENPTIFSQSVMSIAAFEGIEGGLTRQEFIDHLVELYNEIIERRKELLNERKD